MITGFNTLEDLYPCLGATARLDAFLGRLAGVEREDAIDAGKRDDGCSRNDQGAITGVDDDFGSGKASRADYAGLIVDFGLN